ncbi:hypothetical protein BBR47_47610 [Brevibacillus brevis NBRC 100599]|uniref:Uncharacterized protein n=1 Tax=Brevibacillus brevis (strain 47 / JCM 6285 / NBRC 100599) TaxID=358681 RepID=C0ZKR1_BREBN|nr:hypothetical protein BBR47_47610 [Brevibacillus brevis NBRC 100599]
MFSPVFGGVLREPADASVGRLSLLLCLDMWFPPLLDEWLPM